MSLFPWTVRIRWLPWRRRARARLATDRWPKMTDGPFSVLARMAWVFLAAPVFAAFACEVLLAVVLAPLVWSLRWAGISAWPLDVRCTVGWWRWPERPRSPVRDGFVPSCARTWKARQVALLTPTTSSTRAQVSGSSS